MSAIISKYLTKHGVKTVIDNGKEIPYNDWELSNPHFHSASCSYPTGQGITFYFATEPRCCGARRITSFHNSCNLGYSPSYKTPIVIDLFHQELMFAHLFRATVFRKWFDCDPNKLEGSGIVVYHTGSITGYKSHIDLWKSMRAEQVIYENNVHHHNICMLYLTNNELKKKEAELEEKLKRM